MSSLTETKDQRQAMLKRIIESHQMELTASYSGAEDIAPFIAGELACAKWAVVTRGGEDRNGFPLIYVYAEDDSLGAAVEQASRNCTDDIYSEIPIEIVNLDTGEVLVPQYERLPWVAGRTYPGGVGAAR